MRDIIGKKKFNNTVVGLELKCFESAHLVVSALRQLRTPSVPLACDLQIIPCHVATVGVPRLLFVFMPAFSSSAFFFHAGGDEVCQFESEVNILRLLQLLISFGGSNWLLLQSLPFLPTGTGKDILRTLLLSNIHHSKCKAASCLSPQLPQQQACCCRGDLNKPLWRLYSYLSFVLKIVVFSHPYSATEATVSTH